VYTGPLDMTALRLRVTKYATATTRARPPMPPTTPPTIAPVLLPDEPPSAVKGSVAVVGVAAEELLLACSNGARYP
jgi:hypothetical protein